tara:strand:+ start:7311 stop:7424 length:114 start_codon:yes stop_codon:yes gene_type:complete
MKGSEELLADYNHLQTVYLADIDLSGGMYLEYQEQMK